MGRKVKYTFTEQQIEYLMNSHDQTIKEKAAHLGVSWNVVGKYMREHGIPSTVDYMTPKKSKPDREDYFDIDYYYLKNVI